MLYAMLSIGLLGLIVWSFLTMALSYREVRVINFAICWNSYLLYILVGFSLLSTFYSKNLTSNTQSAGNCSVLSSCASFVNSNFVRIVQKLLILLFSYTASLLTRTREVVRIEDKLATSASETTREGSFNFYAFNQLRLKANLTPINKDWLAWFVGFSEGDGAILVTHKSQQVDFIISQKHREVLDHIVSVLGFGNVKSIQNKHNKNGYFRLAIYGKNNLYMLTALFNGNLFVPHRINQVGK
ncbi:MAG: hypothetical protein EOP34_03145 [Rickettsiales bacterium]|nr:MAG: hypothetical protein EOP34_03145 [Rickettsiales bacterium]